MFWLVFCFKERKDHVFLGLVRELLRSFIYPMRQSFVSEPKTSSHFATNSKNSQALQHILFKKKTPYIHKNHHIPRIPKNSTKIPKTPTKIPTKTPKTPQKLHPPLRPPHNKRPKPLVFVPPSHSAKPSPERTVAFVAVQRPASPWRLSWSFWENRGFFGFKETSLFLLLKGFFE